MEKLYKFLWGGRDGDVESLFIANEEKINNSIGKRVYFGEILGKHSEVEGILERNDLSIISSDKEFIELTKKTFGKTTLCGYNPLDYIDD